MKSSLLFCFLLVSLLVSGCLSSELSTTSRNISASQKASIEGDEIPAVPEVDQRSEAFARFATGISYEINDKSDLALEEFYRAALADPANEMLAMEVGQRFLDLKHPEKSVEVLLLASQKPHASGNIFSWLARAYLAAGKTNLAMNASQTAIKKTPQSISGYQTLSDILLKTGRSGDLVKFLNNASRQTNSEALFLIQLGDLYGKAMPAQPKEAEVLKQRGLDVLNRASDLKPANPNIRQKMADTFAQLDDGKKAAEIYLTLLSEFRDVPLMRDAIREKLTNIYLKSSDKSKAIDQLEAIVRDSPTRYPEAWYYLGTFAYDEKNYAKAANCFERAIVVNPAMEQAYFDLAGSQINLNQAGEALKTLEKARAKFPNNFTAEFFTGLAFSRLKNFPEALKHFTVAESIGTISDAKRLTHVFYFQVGTTLERNHDYEQAEKYFQKCLEMEPNFPEALNYLGYMWAERGVNLEKARGLIESAVKLEPKNAAYLDSLGWVLYKLNEHESALEHLLQAAALSEDPDAAVYDHIGDVYRALKQTGKAREAWQKSLTIEPSESIRKKLQANSSL